MNKWQGCSINKFSQSIRIGIKIGIADKTMMSDFIKIVREKRGSQC